MRSRQNGNYSFQFKLSIVELYLSNELSYHELAMQNGINNPATITRWINDFRMLGPDALNPKKKGHKKTLDKDIQKDNKTKITISSETIDTTAEYVKKLEDELLELRIKNAYLKELRRFRLKEKSLLKEQRELSTAFEKNSN